MTEKKYLAIPALILSDMALIIAWIPVINKLSLLLIGASVFLALISLIINRKSNKALTAASLWTALLALVLYGLSLLFFQSSLNQLEELLTPIAKLLQDLLAFIP